MQAEFKLNADVQDNVLVMATEGYINNEGGEKIADVFSEHFKNGITQVVINLEHTTVVNSIGISYLIEVIDLLNEKEGKLIFTNLDPAIEKTLAIMGLFNFAGKEKSVTDAVKAFSV